MSSQAPEQLRDVAIELGIIRHAEGSAQITCGNTRVVCSASVIPEAPSFLKGRNTGWITAEYGMLPRSTHTRRRRDVSRGKIDGRSSEIQRLIGRSLRQAVEMGELGERTLYIDCDVIEADGGTRTASITGGMVALAQALHWMRQKEMIPGIPIRGFVAAVSVGVVGGRPALDLCYEKDAAAEVDMNVVMNEKGRFIEIQGTAEGEPFDDEALGAMLDLARGAIAKLIALQKKALGPEIMKAIEG